MALKITMPLGTGVNAEYFNVQRIDYYPLDGVADVYVNGYISEDAREEGKQAVYSNAFRMPITGNETRAGIYNALKQLDCFAGAEDV